MDILQTDAKMEGWLYTIGSNRFGLQFSRKRYLVLHENTLKSYKTKPVSDKEEPVRSAILDSCIRVIDNGKESINRKVFFTFTIHNTSNHDDQLKLGASSPEEAGRWIRSLQDAALKECTFEVKTLVACSKRRWPSLRSVVSTRADRRTSVDWTADSSVQTEARTTDVIAPSPWKIFGCQNGLRLFKEAEDWDSCGRHWDDHPAIMAVGVVDGTSEAIFRTLMSLGSSRAEWDFCFYRGSVVEHLDGHTDIVHQQLYSDWLPWGMQRRDLLLRRYWRREDDGTYVILYHSVFHKKCPPQKGYVRACFKSGGFVITPVNQGKQSIVKHMLAVDWKYWKLYMRPSSARSITIRMLERVAALREMVKAKAGRSSEYSSLELPKDIGLPQVKKEDVMTKVQGPEASRKTEQGVLMEEEVEKQLSGGTSLMGLNDASDEFFDVPEATETTDDADYYHSENEWSRELVSKMESTNTQHPKLSSAAVFVKKLHDLAVQKKVYLDLQEGSKDNSILYTYGATLQEDPSFTSPCSWTAADPSTFLIRGENYLKDHQKVKATSTSMLLVGADWIKSEKREDDLGSRPGGIVQKYAAKGGLEFFFVVNIQVPAGSTMYTLSLYYMTRTPLENNPLLHRFVNGDDTYRNSRFKLIPYISQGSWIVKQSVGKKACLIGQALEVHYFRGKNYLEVEIDVSSSTVARGVVNLVLGYLNNLVIEMAFVIQGNTQDELPEILVGTCRLNHLDASKSVTSKNMA
ncbi:PH domain-containing protein/START domain-containing protein/DUF1336 domain-containing protein [Cephalotus follicularis]|uniref:PH domain-containing protein/START domain-containing protein/DUF1336 domain-containing protein n=1 Tax=Cephalotus follicularis TaxID=3775 RepID=A0A1Q3CVJ3_CEPFO|nr:PH domain-containing protein/START domain-containing protein/DUF1336 domain-containing protein [Cephalotus follicularis]